jgi:hypothetical protein
VKIDLVDSVGAILFRLGIAILATALLVALFSSHPRALNHSAAYLAFMGCGLVPLVVGGFTHLNGWGLKPNSSENSSPKSPRAPRL